MDCSKFADSAGATCGRFRLCQGGSSTGTDNASTNHTQTGTIADTKTNTSTNHTKALPSTNTEAHCSETYS